MHESVPVQTNGCRKRRTSFYHCRLLQLEGWNSRIEDLASHKETKEVMVTIPLSCPDVVRDVVKGARSTEEREQRVPTENFIKIAFLGNRVLHSVVMAMKATPTLPSC